MLLEVINLNFDYPDTGFDYQPEPLLQHISFSLPSSTLLHLRGKNGAGKTTLLKLLAGLLQPVSGDIRYEHQSITPQLSNYQQNLCYVGHKTGISLSLTVLENIRFDLQFEEHGPLDSLFEQFDLSQYQHTPCYQLSAGMRRRVGLLRLLVAKKKLWLLDEPLVALDQETIEHWATVIQLHLHQGGQVVLTSHQPLPPMNVNYQAFFL